MAAKRGREPLHIDSAVLFELMLDKVLVHICTAAQQKDDRPCECVGYPRKTSLLPKHPGKIITRLRPNKTATRTSTFALRTWC